MSGTKASSPTGGAPAKTSYVCTLTALQIAKLRELLTARGWQFDTAPYAYWKAAREKTTVAAYESGKVSVQGKGTAEVVQFVIEPELLGEARFGYETQLAEVETPDMFTPHAGIDESGKGDFFGPLVVAAAFVTPDTAREFLSLGVADSKTIKSERRIVDLAQAIRQRGHDAFGLVVIGPAAYNRLYTKFRNVNRMLAWGHARALENLLEKVSDCPRAISDQFGDKRLVQQALLERGRTVKLEQMTKAERDVAVAAASILARHEFVRRLQQLGTEVGVTLPKGAGPGVDQVAADLARRGGEALLATVAKLHFRTAARALGRPEPERDERW